MHEFINEALDKQDLDLINGYKNSILMTENTGYKLNFAPIERILEPWADAKNEFLYRLLGKNVILEKEVRIQKTDEELVKNLRDENAKYTLLTNNFFNHLFYKCMVPCNPNLVALQKVDGYSQFFGGLAIIGNTYNGEDLVIKNQNGEMMKIQKGIKLIKLYKNLVDFYDLTDEVFYNGFFGNQQPHTATEVIEIIRNAQSVVRNQLYLKGTLCLSIHPLDYMTMSDNANNWSTCMRWKDGGGDYRSGTVEMLNSPYVVVGYLRSSTPFTFYNLLTKEDCSWNSKKWRCLFIVSKECIVSIKDYPFRNPNLTKMCVEWLRNLAAKNLDWHYDSSLYHYNDNDNSITSDEKDGPYYDHRNFEFTTNHMYNDFGAIPSHMMFIKNAEENRRIDIDYSGLMECMICGNTEIDLDGEENSVVCDDCLESHRCHCARCGERIYNNDSIYTFDDYDCDYEYCEYCAFEIGFQCPVCGDMLHYDSSYHIYMIESNEVGERPIEDIVSEGNYEPYMADICIDCSKEFFDHPNRIFATSPTWLKKLLEESDKKYEVYLIGKKHNEIIAVTNDHYAATKYSCLPFDFFDNELPPSIVEKIFETSPKKIF